MATDLINSPVNPSKVLEPNVQGSSLIPGDNDPYGLSSPLTILNSSFQAAAASSPNLQVITPNSEVVQNRIVFSTVNEEARPAKSLILRNTGNAPLTVTLNLGDSLEKNNAVRPNDHQRGSDFKIINAPTGQAFTLAAGASRTISVKFQPQRSASVSTTPITHTFNGENYASLTFNSNDPDQPTTKVNLAGINFANYEGKNEPSLAEMIRTFGFGTNVGTENLILGGEKKLLGDEVYSPYWLRADPTKPVEVWALAVTSSRQDEPHARLDFVAKPGSGGNSGFLYEFAGTANDDSPDSPPVPPYTGNAVPGSNARSGGENQKLLPKILIDGVNMVPTADTVSFDPTKAFGLRVNGSYTDDNRNGTSNNHNWRFFPAYDANGILIPHTWIAAQDQGNALSQFKNFDYNDQVYLLKNARPENLSLDPSIGGLVPSSKGLIYNFNKAYPGSLKDKDGQTIGFTGVQLNKNDGYTPTASYKPSLLDIVPGSSVLRVTSTAGSNGGADNTLVNGLQTTFDGRAGKALITTKLLGSLSYLNAGVEQAGVMFGPDDDNYIKLAARVMPGGGTGLEFYKEIKGVGDRMGQLIPIANPGSLQSLELMLFTDPQAGTVRAAYRAIGSGGNTGIVSLPSFIAFKGSDYGRFLTAQSKAGILTSNKGGTPFTATFDNFAVKSNETTPSSTVYHRLDVGGSSYTDRFGRFWSTDNLPGFSPPLFTPTNAPSETGAGSQANIGNTTNDRLYRTYRARLPGVSPTAENRLLTYNLPVSKTPGKYHVRLHFAEIFFGVPGGNLNGGVGTRLFDIAVENERGIKNFDITAAAGGSMKAVVLPFENVQVKDGILNIRLKARANYGAISGIEVLQ